MWNNEKYFIFSFRILLKRSMESKIRIAADNKIPFLKGVLDKHSIVDYHRGSEINNALIKDTDALIIRTRTHCNEALLKDTAVKFIATATIGFDHIDADYCSRNNIKWVNAPGCNSTSVMQYIASALCTAAGDLGLDLTKMTIGIAGAGNVGSKVARLCRTIGMNVLINDPPRARREGSEGFVSLDELKAQSDIISFHVPLNKSGEDKTYHLADEKFFKDLAPGKVLFNTSRGAVVETKALKESIENGIVRYSVIDVWEGEPDLDTGLLQLVNIATPHIAGYSADGKANGTAVCVNAVNNHFNLDLPESWYPADIPLPLHSVEIEVDNRGKSRQEVLSEIILYTYRIKDDDQLLRNSPASFEKLRDDYPIRREYPVYRISLRQEDGELFTILKALGFRVAEGNVRKRK